MIPHFYYRDDRSSGEPIDLVASLWGKSDRGAILSKRGFANDLRLSFIEIDNFSGEIACVPYEIRIIDGNRWERHNMSGYPSKSG
jgi:hypothetical protein